MYQRQIQVYKGIENVLEFRLVNAEQRPVDTQGYIPKFLAFDENKNLIIKRDGVVLDDGSSSTKGLFTVTLTENDLLNIKQQYFSYTVYLTDSEGKNIITYSDTNFGNSGSIKISATAFPGPKESKQIQGFSKVDINTFDYVTEALDASPGINSNEALHTAVIYSNGYVGDVYIEGTLENQITDYTQWAQLAELVFDGSETEPVPVNFYGVLNYIRFKTSDTPNDKISKILIRN